MQSSDAEQVEIIFFGDTTKLRENPDSEVVPGKFGNNLSHKV